MEMQVRGAVSVDVLKERIGQIAEARREGVPGIIVLLNRDLCALRDGGLLPQTVHMIPLPGINAIAAARDRESVLREELLKMGITEKFLVA